MTAEHAIENNDNENVLEAKNNNTSKKATRTTKQKAKPAENLAETTDATAKKPARKSVARKKTSAATSEDAKTSSTENIDENQTISTTKPARKQTVRKKRTAASNASINTGEDITQKQATDDKASEEKIPPVPARKRGRPRKIPVTNTESLQVQTSEAATVDIEIQTSTIPPVGKKLPRSLRRAPKSSTAEQAPLMSSTIKDIHEAFAEIHTHTPETTQKIDSETLGEAQSTLSTTQAETDSEAVPGDAATADNTEMNTVTHSAISFETSSALSTTQAETDSDAASGDAMALQPKRGRRGGRGKRGKKRAELAQFPSAHEDESSPLLTKKTGTSLNTDKPGIARTSGTKKSQESTQRKMLISMVQGEQVEVALVENGIIHEYYLEMLHQVKCKGNIYKGVVNNIDTNLQAAFINYGNHKNGFLQIDEIHPEYYQSHHEAVRGKKFPPIQKIIKPGQEILVQVVKEPTGNKGAFLTTWLSLAGRFLVLTPGQEQIGVSRKVDNDEERSRLREMMTGIDPGKGLGVIVRTVSAGTSKTTLKSDLQYLKRVWKEIRKRGVSESAPALLHMETSLAQRAIRDYLTDDVSEVWVDSTDMAENLRETVSLLFPRKKELIRIHADVRQTLWERFNMQRQLDQIYAREVHLPSGGRLVFDQTEALMAIDINSGKISGKGNFEAMALKTNLEAAETIARHLKLRDIGGQVVIDFIEMRDRANVREVEKTLKNAMKNDRARHDVARMSSFGLLEIVRQRTGSSALAITMEACPHCKGTGIRRNIEWQALQALCEIERKGRGAQGNKYIYETNYADLALYLLNHKRQRISELETQLKVNIEIRFRP